MDRIFSAAQKPFSGIAEIALAIKQVGADQQHLGILHRDAAANTVLMLHLAWHHRLRNEPPDDGFLWVAPAIHPRRLVQVRAFCRKIWRSNFRQLPYALSPPNDCFDEATGAFLLGPTRLGLTCATFVLAVFHATGLRLVDYGTWPVDRPGDREWQEKIVALLEQTGAAQDHVAAVRNEISSVRYRPEEVAGAAVGSPWPASFDDAVRHAVLILERLSHA